MRKFSMNFKLLFVIAGLSASCMVSVALGVYGSNRVYAELNAVSEVLLARKDAWAELNRVQQSLALYERDYISALDKKERTETGKKIESLKSEFEDRMKRVEKISSKASKQKVAEYKAIMEEWLGINQLSMGKADNGDSSGARLLAESSGRDQLRKAEGIFADITEINKKDTANDVAAVEAAARQIRNWNVGISLASILICMSLGYWIVSGLRRSIEEILESISGDAKLVDETSSHVAESATKLSQAATEQSASLQETAASSQELTSMVQRNLENSQQASMTSSTSQASAERGKQVVQEMTRAISDIESSNQAIMAQVNESNRQISEITKVIAEIGNKTKVINDIVFQTKLLSFNASVEAARAGEHGKGFAVVAEEVGNLAQMSGTAAKEISTMLESSIAKVESIVRDTKTSVERLVLEGREKVETGTRVAQECSDVLDQIVGHVTEVASMSNDISHASKEQSQGVAEISKAVTQLELVTQTNASAAEEASAAATQLAEQAASLKRSIFALGVVVQGSSGDQDFDVSNSGDFNPVKASATLASKKQIDAMNKSENKSDKKSERKSDKKSPKKVAAKSEPLTVAAQPAIVQGAPERAAQKPASNVVAMPEKTPENRPENKPDANGSAKGSNALPQSSASIKMASGGDVQIPSENDPRFQDV